MVDTLPKLLVQDYQRWGDTRIAMRQKAFGIWKEFTWSDVYERVRDFALALVSNGFEPGDKIATIGNNAPELFWAELAAQAMGGVVIGVSPNCLPDEVKFYALHSTAKFIVAEDQEQVDKIIEVRDELPLLKRIIYWNPKGLKSYHAPFLIEYNDFLQQGKKYKESHPGLIDQAIAKTKSDDNCLICYTLGTTDLPKGVIIKHKTFITWTKEILNVFPLSDGSNSVSYMPLGWIVEQMLGLGNMLLGGVTMNFPEKPEMVQADIREIAPNIIWYPSRLWERLSTEIQLRISDSSFVKRTVYNLFVPVGYKFADLVIQKKKPNLVWRAIYAVANLLLFRPLKDKHGLSNVRHAITTDASLSPDVFRFFRTMGINIKQVYALTETGVVTSHGDDDIHFESVGVPMGDDKGVRISEDGEIVIDIARYCDDY